MTLGAAICVARASRQMNQGQLAQAAGVSQSFIHHIEKNTRVPGLDVIETIARAVGWPTYLLIALSEPTSVPLEHQEFIGRHLFAVLTKE